MVNSSKIPVFLFRRSTFKRRFGLHSLGHFLTILSIVLYNVVCVASKILAVTALEIGDDKVYYQADTMPASIYRLQITTALIDT